MERSCPGSLPRRIPVLPLAPGVSGELIEARAFDMWAGGEWPSWVPSFWLSSRMAGCPSLEMSLSLSIRWQLLEHFLGFRKRRGGTGVSSYGWPWLRIPVCSCTYSVTLSGACPWPDPYFKCSRLEDRGWLGRGAQWYLMLCVQWDLSPKMSTTC